MAVLQRRETGTRRDDPATFAVSLLLPEVPAMRSVTSRLALAGLLMATPCVVMAQTNISQNAQFSSTSTVQYLPFTVSTGGLFDISTSGLNHLDPMLLLFQGTSTNG